MKKPQKKDKWTLISNVANVVVSASRTTQLRLFHGLVPAVATLRESCDQLDALTQPGWFRSKRQNEALVLAHALKAQIADSVRVIETRAAELGYPLQDALAAYTASGATIGTLAAMESDLDAAGGADWDAWAASLTDEPGDPAA